MTSSTQNPRPNNQQTDAEAFFRRNPYYFIWYYEPCDSKPYIYPATAAEMILEIEADLKTPPKLLPAIKDFASKPNLPWSEDVVARFEDQWNWGDTTQWDDPDWKDDPWFLPELLWGGLSSNSGLPWSIGFIERFQHHLDWRWLSMNQGVPWSIELIDRFSDKWEWNLLSFLHPWSPEIIEHFADRWNWDWLAYNEQIAWSAELVDQFDWFWQWTRLSRNPTLPWSIEFLDHNVDRWDWITLSSNKGLPWSDKFIERYADRWSWEDLGENPAITWSASLVEDLTRRLDWRITKLDAYRIPWTREIIERFIDQWNWETLSGNGAMPWSIAWIEQFAERWDWEKLSGNRSLPWSLELIDHYIDLWDWTALSFNKGFQLSPELIERFVDRWNGSEISLRTGELDMAWPASLAERMLRPPKAIQGIVSQEPVFLIEGEDELSRFNLTKQQITQLYIECTAKNRERYSNESPEESFQRGEVAREARKFQEAASWYEKAYTKGHPDAWTELFLLYVNAHIEPPDDVNLLELLFEYHEDAVVNRNLNANYVCGRLAESDEYSRLFDSDSDWDDPFELGSPVDWYTTASEHGHKRAAQALDRWHYLHDDYERQYEEDLAKEEAAFHAQWGLPRRKFLEQAANAGSTEAQLELGKLYADAGRFADADFEKEEGDWWAVEFTNYRIAADWLASAANKGNAQAAYELVMLLRKVQSLVTPSFEGDERFHSEYVRYFRADKGATGSGLSRRDPNDSLMIELAIGRWLVRLIELSQSLIDQGDLLMMHQLAVAISSGENAVMKPDDEVLDSIDPIALVQQAAKSGFVPSQILLGKHYAGYFTKQFKLDNDDERAFYWFSRASDQNDPEGQFFLGDLYDNGQGIVRDMGKATSLYRAAAEQGFRLAQRRLDRLASSSATQ